MGDSVKVLSLNLKGTVSTLPDAKGNLFRTDGYSPVTGQSCVDLERIDEPVITAPSFNRTGSGKIKMSKSASVGIGAAISSEKPSDEAVSELDKYLDDAYIAHLPSVRIVHGKGTGALQKSRTQLSAPLQDRGGIPSG